MTLFFEVNNKKVEFNYRPLWGIFRITVDGHKVASGCHLIGGKKKSDFLIDDKTVSIIIDQPMFMTSLRKRSYKVLVDNKIYKVFNRWGRPSSSYM